MMTRRSSILAISMLGLLSLAIAYLFMQLYLQLQPCPLCIIARYAIGIMSLAGVLCWVVYPSWSRVLMVIMLLSLLGGLATEVRHVYLEWFPYESSSCFFGVNENAFTDFFINAFAGRSDCSLAGWRFLGFSLAEFTLGLFIFLVIYMAFIFCTPKNNNADD